MKKILLFVFAFTTISAMEFNMEALRRVKPSHPQRYLPEPQESVEYLRRLIELISNPSNHTSSYSECAKEIYFRAKCSTCKQKYIGERRGTVLQSIKKHKERCNEGEFHIESPSIQFLFSSICPLCEYSIQETNFRYRKRDCYLKLRSHFKKKHEKKPFPKEIWQNISWEMVPPTEE